MGSFAPVQPLGRQRFGHQRPSAIAPHVPWTRRRGRRSSKSVACAGYGKKIVDIAICPILSAPADAGLLTRGTTLATTPALKPRPSRKRYWRAVPSGWQGAGRNGVPRRCGTRLFVVIGQRFEHLVDEGFIQPAALQIL